MPFESKHLRQEAEYTWPFVRSAYQIKTLINIGAHNGDFAAFLCGYFKPEQCYLFEPQPSQQEQLAALVARLGYGRVFPVALGDRTGKMKFYTNTHSPSSSLFPPGQVGMANFPEISDYRETEVEVRRLDEALEDCPLPPDILMVMDAQGAEKAIVNGGSRVFRKVKCLLVEMSFVQFYAGQPLFEGVHAALTASGLRLRGFKNQICSEKDAGPLFAHCLYVRDDAS